MGSSPIGPSKLESFSETVAQCAAFFRNLYLQYNATAHHQPTHTMDASSQLRHHRLVNNIIKLPPKPTNCSTGNRRVVYSLDLVLYQRIII